MTRTYDSALRAEQARQTRLRILDAAVELHAQGITEYEPLAKAAGVSVATVRKHFPKKEMIFQGCTAHFFAGFEPPGLEVAATVADPGERVTRVASEMCRGHEETSNLVWHSYVYVKQSPAIAGALAALAGLVDAAADVVVDGPGLELGEEARSAARVRVRVLLDTLTYRVFRVHAGLGVEATRLELTALLEMAVGIPVSE